MFFLERGADDVLGVPGIFHEEEAKAAGVFGFPQFIPLYLKQILELPEEECEGESFGYWCRQMREQPLSAKRRDKKVKMELDLW